MNKFMLTHKKIYVILGIFAIVISIMNIIKIGIREPSDVTTIWEGTSGYEVVWSPGSSNDVHLTVVVNDSTKGLTWDANEIVKFLSADLDSLVAVINSSGKLYFKKL